MTQNQIAYGRLVEERRHNQASEMADLIEAKARDRTSLTDQAYRSKEMEYMGYDAQTRRITAEAAASQASTRLSELAEAIRHNSEQEKMSRFQYMWDVAEGRRALNIKQQEADTNASRAATAQSQVESDISRNIVRNITDILGEAVPGFKAAFDALTGMGKSIEDRMYGKDDG